MPGSVHSGSVSWDACGHVFSQTLRVSSFPDRFPHYAWPATVSPLRLHWVKCVRMFRCNLPPALLAEWPGSFMCHCHNTGVERTLSKSQHTKLTLEKKILPPLLLGFELATFQSQVWHSTNKLSQLPSSPGFWILTSCQPASGHLRMRHEGVRTENTVKIKRKTHHWFYLHHEPCLRYLHGLSLLVILYAFLCL